MTDVSTIEQANAAVTVVQALTTYSKADETPSVAPDDADGALANLSVHRDQVSEFWRTIRASGGAPKQRFSLRGLVLSEWVPRLPGLYFQPGAEHLRTADQWVPAGGGGYRVYRPDAKSRHLMGGIGTLRLGIATDGWRLCSASEVVHDEIFVAGPLSEQFPVGCGNASAGIPLLISDDVWTELQLSEGAVIDLVNVPWRSLPTAWSPYFLSITDLPRGGLVVERAEQLSSHGQNVPSAVHPFSVMHYDSPNGPRLDFVYAQGLANAPGWRTEVQDFFTWFCRVEGRNGSLLLGADLVDPMWDARYDKPADLRAANPDDLALLDARALGTDVSTRLIDLLQRWLITSDPTMIDMLGGDIVLPPGWQHVNGSTAERVNALLAASVRNGKLTALFDAAQRDGLRQPPSWPDIALAQARKLTP
jgi:hypothetical protein